MEPLFINNKPWTLIRYGIGIMFILSGIAYFISELSDSGFHNYFILFTYLLAGAANLTRDFGLSRSYLRPEDNRLIIKLMNKLRPIIAEDSEIEKIIMKRTEIEVNLKSRKPVRINLITANRDEKNKIYHFFMNYSKERAIQLERIPGR